MPEKAEERLLEALRDQEFKDAYEILSDPNIIFGDFNVNCSNSKGWTPMHYAASAGDVKMIQALLALNPSVKVQTNASGATPTHFAAARKYYYFFFCAQDIIGS